MGNGYDIRYCEPCDRELLIPGCTPEDPMICTLCGDPMEVVQ